jgi:hypothetical protein
MTTCRTGAKPECWRKMRPAASSSGDLRRHGLEPDTGRVLADAAGRGSARRALGAAQVPTAICAPGSGQGVRQHGAGTSFGLFRDRKSAGGRHATDFITCSSWS